MPRIEEVFSIFLASPGDVSEERERLLGVISRWNTTWGRNQGLRLEILCWENDAYPGIGVDAQAVINSQIPQDYDLFIGIMWSRFGTPTGRASSGTEEEFEIALNRHKNNKGGVDILFYFKNAPVNPREINTEQLEKVNSFRKKIQSEGLLTWDFTDTDNFEKIVELHITRYIQKEKKNSELKFNEIGKEGQITKKEKITATQNETKPESKPDEEDYGYVDSIEELNEESEKMSALVDRFTQAQTEFTDELHLNTLEMQSISGGNQQATPKAMREIIQSTANTINKLSEKIERDLPEFHEAINNSMRALMNVATITAEIYPEKIDSTKELTKDLLDNISSARVAVEDARDAAAGLPRMTKELNQSKRRNVSCLNAYIKELQTGEDLITQVLQTLDSMKQAT